MPANAGAVGLGPHLETSWLSPVLGSLGPARARPPSWAGRSWEPLEHDPDFLVPEGVYRYQNFLVHSKSGEENTEPTRQVNLYGETVHSRPGNILQEGACADTAFVRKRVSESSWSSATGAALSLLCGGCSHPRSHLQSHRGSHSRKLDTATLCFLPRSSANVLGEGHDPMLTKFTG